MTTHPLRDYQVKIIDRIEAQIKYGKRRIMLQLPTGAGKTRCFVELAKRHRLNPYASDRNCLIVAHRKELIDQAVEALTKEGVKKWEIGIIRANVQESRHCVIQVASIQSLIRREFPKAGLVIIDEAHHATADSYKTIIDHYQDSIILGVTATPARTDGKGFKGSFEILLEGPTVKALTAKNYLCPYKLYAYTKQRIDTKSVKIQAGDYQLNQLADVVMQSEVRADLVETWKKHAFGKKTVVFAVNVELSKQYADIYNAAGYKAEHIDGDTPEKQRVAILSRFKHGQTKILCNCNIVTEGFDLPEMECVQIVRPTQSLILWLQMVGRSLRTAKGKSHAIILDHTDNYKRLGLPDSNRQWSLNEVTFSGFTPNPDSREGDERRQREIQHKEGELVEIYSNEDVPITSSQPVVEEKPTKKALWIDGMRWDVDSKVASAISQKLERLEELEKLLVEKDRDLQKTNTKVEELQKSLDEKIDRSNETETTIERNQSFSSTYEDYEEALKKIQNLLNELPIGNRNKLENENYETTISAYTETIQLNPNDATAYNNRGVAKQALNDYQGAISDYTESIRLDAEDGLVYYNRGVAKSDLGDHHGAINDYTQAIKLNPDYALAYSHRGIAILDLGDKNEALANIKKAAMLFHKDGDTENYQESLKRIKEINRKISQIKLS